MIHSTTTFDHIVALYGEERRLLDKTQLTAAERAQFTEIRQALAKLWPARRAEQVFEAHGPPRLISSPEPLDRRRRIAFGIPPLLHSREVGQ